MADNDGKISRRTVATGIAWTVPTIAVAATAPAFAVSKPTVGGYVCALTYGAGINKDEQVHGMQLGVKSDGGTIPSGTVVTYTFTSALPTLSEASGNGWSAIISSSGNIRTVTISVNTAVSGFCGPKLDWGTIGVTSVMSIAMASSHSAGAITPSTGSLRYTVARRFWHSNGNPEAAHKFTAKAGSQTCYPSVTYSAYTTPGRTNPTACGESGGNNTSTTYPTAPTCVIADSAGVVAQRC